MNWENSKVLTPLKHDFLELFFSQNQQFYLTGGSALGIFYLQHRLSYDLDFFTDEQVNWHVIENIMLSIAKNLKAECSTITASPQFYRFQLNREKEREIIDFVIELVPQIDPGKKSFGKIRVDTLREIGINKICTLISRCELKDVIDLYFLKKNGFDIKNNINKAKEKEGGFEPGMISYLLSNVDTSVIPEYVIETLDIEDFKKFIKNLQKDMASLSFPKY